MKKICSFLLFSIVLMSSFSAQAALSEGVKKECEKLLDLAERKQMEWVYPYCGFNDNLIAWNEWAPYVTQHKYAKAMFYLCSQSTENDYSGIYCERSASLGYLPAQYVVAQGALNEGSLSLYERSLKKIIAAHDIKDKLELTTLEDKTVLKAYTDLGFFYLNQNQVVEAIQYLTVAADAGDVDAAHALATLYFWSANEQEQDLSVKYLWKAISLGCPAAEADFGLLLYLDQKKASPLDVKDIMFKRLQSCQLPTHIYQTVQNVNDCDCPEVLSWYQSQRTKPFIVVKIDDDLATLQDENGTQYDVRKADKVTDGFVVEDVRASAVIVRRVNERHVLLYRENQICVQLCQNPNVLIKEQLDNLSPYQLRFTQDECQNLAMSIETLNNPMEPFKGLPECQLQDWKTWGESALRGKRNKHLFLLANYDRSNYIPSFVANAAISAVYDNPKAKQLTILRLAQAIKMKPTDALSRQKHEEAYCKLATLYLNAFEEAPEANKALSVAAAGAALGYPRSLNMLGVLYAAGLGVVADQDRAKTLFLKADEMSDVPYLEARQNYQLIMQGGDLSHLSYGQCMPLTSSNADRKEILNSY